MDVAATYLINDRGPGRVAVKGAAVWTLRHSREHLFQRVTKPGTIVRGRCHPPDDLKG